MHYSAVALDIQIICSNFISRTRLARQYATIPAGIQPAKAGTPGGYIRGICTKFISRDSRASCIRTIFFQTSLTGRTWLTCKPDVWPDGSLMRLRQHGTYFFFFTNMLHAVQHVCEKAWDLPPGRRRVGPFIQAHAGFGTDRV